MGASVRTGEGARVKGLRWGSLRGFEAVMCGDAVGIEAANGARSTRQRGKGTRPPDFAAQPEHAPRPLNHVPRTTSDTPGPTHHVLHTTSHVPRPTRHVVMSTSTIFLCNVCRSVSLVPGQPHARAQYTHTHAPSIHPHEYVSHPTNHSQPTTANRTSSSSDRRPMTHMSLAGPHC